MNINMLRMLPASPHAVQIDRMNRSGHLRVGRKKREEANRRQPHQRNPLRKAEKREIDMELIDHDVIDPVLSKLSGFRFTTQEFINIFRRDNPEIYEKVRKQYGAGGKGSGRHYSAKVHIAKSLSHHHGKEDVRFIEYIKAPKVFGSPVIALWECNKNGADTVRISSSIENDIEELLHDATINETQRQQLILSRIGQGQFRKDLINYWRGCSVTGCDEVRILTASHMKPWSLSTNIERLDVNNGLLLTPNLDRLFDRGLITFANDGGIVVSSLIKKTTLKLLGVDKSMKIQLNIKQKQYMKFHRENVFESR
jgi:hypothetical protein